MALEGLHAGLRLLRLLVSILLLPSDGPAGAARVQAKHYSVWQTPAGAASWHSLLLMSSSSDMYRRHSKRFKNMTLNEAICTLSLQKHDCRFLVFAQERGENSASGGMPGWSQPAQSWTYLELSKGLLHTAHVQTGLLLLLLAISILLLLRDRPAGTVTVQSWHRQCFLVRNISMALLLPVSSSSSGVCGQTSECFNHM